MITVRMGFSSLAAWIFTLRQSSGSMSRMVYATMLAAPDKAQRIARVQLRQPVIGFVDVGDNFIDSVLQFAGVPAAIKEARQIIRRALRTGLCTTVIGQAREDRAKNRIG